MPQLESNPQSTTQSAAQPSPDLQRFEHDLRIAFAIIRQREPWIFRDLHAKSALRAELARGALVAEIMKVVARFDVKLLETPIRLHRSP